MIEDLFDKKERHILHQILEVLERIERRLNPHFTLKIEPRHGHVVTSYGRLYHAYYCNTGELAMAAVTAGQSASFFLTATASDNSTVVLANPVLAADDSSVTIAPDTSDASNLTFTVTVPASDTQTSFNLSATADASSNTSTTPQLVSASLAVTISPAAVPVTFTLSISEK